MVNNRDLGPMCYVKHYRLWPTDRAKSKHNIMNTFLKMTSAIYTMAGLGAFEESKLYKENLEEEVVDDR